MASIYNNLETETGGVEVVQGNWKWCCL